MVEEFRLLLDRLGLSGKDFASKLGLSYGSYKSMLSVGCPRWVKGFMLGYRLGKGKD